MIDPERIREFALSLPDATEEPHFHFASFRINGRIFATMPPSDRLLHVFAPEEDRIVAIAQDPEVYQELNWGKRVVGLRVVLEHADPALVEDLLQAAYDSKRKKPAS
jgi:hypothetical protein